MSPRPAIRPVEPPSGRIICSLRAPELSATSSMLLIITAMAQSPSISMRLLAFALRCDFRHQRRLAHNVLQFPPLQLGKRPRLFNPNHIANVRLVLLVVRVELFIPRHHASIKWVRFLARDLDHDRLLHAVGDYFAHHFLAPTLRWFILWGRRLCCGFRHYRFSVAAARVRSLRMVLTRAISLRSPRIFFRLSVWPIFSWNFSLNNWSARSCPWCLSSSSVKLRILSDFIKSISSFVFLSV